MIKDLEALLEAPQREAEEKLRKAKISADEQKIIMAATHYGRREVNRHARVEDLAKALNPNNPEKAVPTVKKLLPGLKKKLSQNFGVKLREIHSHTYNESVFSLDPATVENSPLEFLPEKQAAYKPHSVLLLADASYATELHPKVLDVGLNHYLTANGFIGPDAKTADKVSDVFVLGALPFIPENNTSVASQYLKILDKKVPAPDDMDTDSGDDPLKLLEDIIQKEEGQGRSVSIDPKKGMAYIEKYVRDRITTLPEAAYSVRDSLERTLGDDFDGDVHLFFGYQDHKNLDIKKKKLSQGYAYHQKQLEKNKSAMPRLMPKSKKWSESTLHKKKPVNFFMPLYKNSPLMEVKIFLWLVLVRAFAKPMQRPLLN